MKISGDLDLGFYIEKDGILVPASLSEWGKFFENIVERTVARSVVSDMDIRTMCTGHNGELTAPPTLYQTGVFQKRHGDERLGAMKREWGYATRKAAERGHRRIVEAVRRGERLGSIRIDQI